MNLVCGILLHHTASLTAVLKSWRPQGRSTPSLWLFECCRAAPCCTHNPFNDHPLRYYCAADVGAAQWGKQHQRDWFLLMGHFIMEGNEVGERGWDGQGESEETGEKAETDMKIPRFISGLFLTLFIFVVFSVTMAMWMTDLPWTVWIDMMTRCGYEEGGRWKDVKIEDREG